ncbi:hypothetical protein C8R45DRAFT_835193 [Mycena sanguinolenta]|nr:hypothetical protein C8R45DRAFT_835193 [Mycena sanguinolenta]
MSGQAGPRLAPTQHLVVPKILTKPHHSPQSSKKEKRLARELKQAHIDAKVQEWMEYTNGLATSMGEEFDMKPRYFLDIFFQGSVHMIKHQEVVNPYNTFKSFKAAELREGTSIFSGIFIIG